MSNKDKLDLLDLFCESDMIRLNDNSVMIIVWNDDILDVCLRYL